MLDAALARETAKRFPMVAAVRVKDAPEAVDKIAGQLALAARAAAGVAVITALLALGSAIAAGQRARQHDAVVLKTLGATRPWLMTAYALEFGALALVACLFAIVAGAAAAFGIVQGLMKMSFVFLPANGGGDGARGPRRDNAARLSGNLARSGAKARAGIAQLVGARFERDEMGL